MKKTILPFIAIVGMNAANATTIPKHSGEYYRRVFNNQTQRPTPKTTYKQNYYQHSDKTQTTKASYKFFSGYRLGIDLMAGNVSNPTTIRYGITDFYTNEKTSEYSFNRTIGGIGLNFGFQHYQKFETELFVDIYAGGAKSAPAYYNYISYPMRVNGYIIPYGVREHYYYPFSEKFKLDLAIGVGGIGSSGSYTDKYDIEAYRQEPWSDTTFMYDGLIGFVYYPWDYLPLRFGYLRANFDSDYIGKGLNKFYFGFSVIFSPDMNDTSKNNK